MKRKGWEGIVSKKKNSLYCPAKNHSEWFKHKNLKKILAAICGIQWKDSLPNSLILGIFRDDSWVYIGKASQGLTFEERRQLKQYAVRHRNDDCPFRDVRLCKGESFTWLKPAVTCWIRFLEWTNDGTMRHPAILGFSHLSAEQANGKEWSIDE